VWKIPREFFQSPLPTLQGRDQWWS